MVPAIRAAPASHPISQEAPASSPDAFDGSDCDDAHLSDGDLMMDSSEKEVSLHCASQHYCYALLVGACT